MKLQQKQRDGDNIRNSWDIPTRWKSYWWNDILTTGNAVVTTTIRLRVDSISIWCPFDGSSTAYQISLRS